MGQNWAAHAKENEAMWCFARRRTSDLLACWCSYVQGEVEVRFGQC